MNPTELKQAASAAFTVAAKAKEAAAALQATVDAMKSCPRGLRAVITRGRKFPKGTVGTVYNTGWNGFGQWAQFDRDDTGERIFITFDNLTLADDSLVAAQAAADEAYAAYDAADHDYRWAQAAWKAAVIKQAGLDLQVRSDVEVSGSGWRDYVRYTTPCNAAASDAEITAALNLLDPQGNSWGALRWSCGTALIERLTPTTVRVEQSTGIAD